MTTRNLMGARAREECFRLGGASCAEPKDPARRTHVRAEPGCSERCAIRTLRPSSASRLCPNCQLGNIRKRRDQLTAPVSANAERPSASVHTILRSHDPWLFRDDCMRRARPWVLHQSRDSNVLGLCVAHPRGPRKRRQS